MRFDHEQSWPVSHLDNSLGRDEIQIVHLVTVRTKDDKIGNVVVLSVAVDVRDLKHVWNAVAAMCTHWIVIRKGSLTVINVLGYRDRVAGLH